MTKFQKVVIWAWLSILVLVGAGAIVRATGSGLGCPDWPRCWGCLIPPTQVEDVQWDNIDLEKYRKKAMQHGRDPESITMEVLRSEFSARETWTEFINRLLATPAALLGLAVLGFSVGEARRGRRINLWLGITAVLIIGINAVVGAVVVSSGLKPGIVTLHSLLAQILLCVYVFAAWRGTDQPWRLSANATDLTWLRRWMVVLFTITLAEVVLGSQVREMTDALALSHLGEDRSEWIGEMEQSWQYLAHRSFSWVIVVVSLIFWIGARKRLPSGPGLLENVVLGVVLAQMVLGVVMAHVHIYAWVQVLHVFLTTLMISAMFLWLLGARRGNERAIRA